jgi:hypothetical protein
VNQQKDALSENIYGEILKKIITKGGDHEKITVYHVCSSMF